MPKISITAKRAKFLWMISRLLSFAEGQGIRLICFQFFQTFEVALQQFEEGKSKIEPRIHSTNHQLWLAMDFVIIDEKDQPIWVRSPAYESLGEFWKGLEGKWGGDWLSLNDVCHFEF